MLYYNIRELIQMSTSFGCTLFENVRLWNLRNAGMEC